MYTEEAILKQIVEGIFNNPEEGKHYKKWQTDDGTTGITIIFKHANEMFDISISKRDKNKEQHSKISMNKYQEALDALEYFAVQYENTETDKQWNETAINIQKAKNILQELVDIANPKKPTNLNFYDDGFIKFLYGNCPNCGKAVDEDFFFVP